MFFSDSKAPPRFTLRIPLFQNHQHQANTGQQTTAITPTASGGELQTDNPFSLTDEEIDGMLEVLQQGSVPPQATVDSILDEDLREVLEMDVDSFLA